MQDIYLQLIDYAEYTTLQQVQLSHCADLIIGTQGAGLMWYAFNTLLIESSFLLAFFSYVYHCREPILGC